MKLNKIMLSLGIATMALSACNDTTLDDKSQWGDARTPQFSTNIVGAQTRMQDSKWADGDKVGIFMKQGTEATAKNIQYKASTTGKLTAEGEKIQYPNETAAVDFTAYYPYSETAKEGTYKVNIADQSDFTVLDLIYSNNAKGLKFGKTDVKLNFTHKLTQVIFDIKAEGNTEGISMQMKDVITEANFDVLTGILTAGTAKADMPIVSKKAYLVIPGTEFTAEFKLGNETKSIVVKADIAKDGQIVTIPVDVKADGETPEDFTVTFGDAKIQDWNKVEGDKIIIDFTDPENPVDPEEPGDDVKEGVIFTETFGDPEKDGSYWPGVNKYKGYDNKNLTFSDPYFDKYDKATVRKTSTLSSHVWLAGKSHTGLKVEGFGKGLKNMKLTFKFADNSGKINLNMVKFHTNNGDVTLPNKQAKKNVFQEVTIDLPEGTEWFSFEADNLVDGFRIDDLQLTAGKGGSVDPVDPTPDPTPGNTTIAQIKNINGEITNDLKVTGVISADDETSNLFRQIILQDETGNIPVMVYMNNKTTKVNTIAKAGDKVEISLKGLFVSEYKGVIQLGYKTEKGTMMPENIARKAINVIGTATPSVKEVANISEFIAGGEENICALVKIANVEFTNGGKDKFYENPKNKKDYYNHNQEVTDSEGNKFVVRTSKFSSIANKTLPAGKIGLKGIMSKFMKDGKTTYQLFIVGNDYKF